MPYALTQVSVSGMRILFKCLKVCLYYTTSRKKKNWVSSKKINLYHFCPSYAFSSLLVRMVYVWYCVLQKVLQERQQKPDFLKNFLNSGTFLTSRGWSRGIMKIRHTLSLIKLCIYGPAFSPFTVTVKNTDICPNTLPNSWGLVWKIC